MVAKQQRRWSWPAFYGDRKQDLRRRLCYRADCPVARSDQRQCRVENSADRALDYLLKGSNADRRALLDRIVRTGCRKADYGERVVLLSVFSIGPL